MLLLPVNFRAQSIQRELHTHLSTFYIPSQALFMHSLYQYCTHFHLLVILIPYAPVQIPRTCFYNMHILKPSTKTMPKLINIYPCVHLARAQGSSSISRELAPPGTHRVAKNPRVTNSLLLVAKVVFAACHMPKMRIIRWIVRIMGMGSGGC